MKIKIAYWLLIALLLPSVSVWSQSAKDAKTTESVTEQIKIERDFELNNLNAQLRANEENIKALTEKLARSQSSETNEKQQVEDLKKLQFELDNRIKILEEAPKIEVKRNGQIAFTELLSIQRDLMPATLFQSSLIFSKNISDVTNLQNYDEFKKWNKEYNSWYSKQDKRDQILNLVSNSINLISDATRSVPLYGSVAQTATSGLLSIINNSKLSSELRSTTPEMINLLNAVGQFESMKSIIDHEWVLINEELKQLSFENKKLLDEQLDYYQIDTKLYDQYLKTSLDYQRDEIKIKCKDLIDKKLSLFESDELTKRQWQGNVKIYMFRVQSLRLRFGQLTMRMLSNINQYEKLVETFSVSSKFPSSFTYKIQNIGENLEALRANFNGTFRPEQYLNDTPVMYLNRT